MNCSQARERILQSSIDDDTQAHIDGCEACAELAASEGQLAHALGTVASPAPDPDGFAKVTQITSEQDADAVWRLRAMPTNRRAAIGLCAALIGAIVYLLAWRRPDWGVYPMMRMGLVAGSMLIATGFGVVLSMPRSYRPERPFAVRLGLFTFLLAIPFVPALFPPAHAAHAASMVPPSLWVGATKCLGLGSLAAVPALLTIRLLQRDAKLELWPTLFSALAAAVGANIALQFHCPIVDPMHLVAGHATLGLVYALLAWAVVRVVVR